MELVLEESLLFSVVFSREQLVEGFGSCLVPFGVRIHSRASNIKDVGTVLEVLKGGRLCLFVLSSGELFTNCWSAIRACVVL